MVNIGKFLLSALITAVNAIIKALGFALQFVFSLLPDSPFQFVMNYSEISEYLPAANYVLPISEALAIFQLWSVAVAAYYLYSVILRWVKAIE